MSSSGLKPLTLKEVVQVLDKLLRGVPEAGVSSRHLGSPALESQGFSLAIQVLGPTQIVQTLGPGPGGLHNDFDIQASQNMLFHHPPDVLWCKHQTGLASFAGVEMQVIFGALWR